MARFKSLILFCIAGFSWSFCFGVGMQVISHWLSHRDASNMTIGFVQGSYYLGLAIGSMVVPALIRVWGQQVLLTGLPLSGLALGVFPWVDSEVGWYASRLIGGLASAMTLVPLETLLNRSSDEANRTRDFGIYGVALTLGGALGFGTGLELFDPGASFPFVVGGFAPIAGGAMLAILLNPAADAEPERAPGQSIDWLGNFLPFGTAWAQGFLEGGMIAFLSLYLTSMGLGKEHAGWFMAAAMVGMIVFQVPVSLLADRLGKTPVLLGCYAATLIALAIVPQCDVSLMLGVWLFLLGACAGAMFPLGMSLLTDRVPPSLLAHAYAWYMMIECVGSNLGAALMGWSRDQWGETAMFPVGALGVIAVPLLLPVVNALRR